MSGLVKGNPTPSDLHIGRGIVYFGLLDGSGLPNGFRDLGEASALSVTFENETLDHKSSRSELRQVDREIAISSAVNVGITLETFSWENLALYFSGDTEENSDNSADTTASQFHWAVLEVTRKGETYHICKTGSSSASAPATDNFTAMSRVLGDRVFKLDAAGANFEIYAMSGFVASTGAGTQGSEIEAVAGSVTNWSLDAERGLLTIPDGSNISAGDHILVKYRYNGHVREVARGLTQSEITGSVLYAAKNANQAGDDFEVHINAVALKGDGDLGFIQGEEFGSFQLSGKAEARPDIDPDAPTLSIVKVRAA